MKTKIFFRCKTSHQWQSFGIFPANIAARVATNLHRINEAKGVTIETKLHQEGQQPTSAKKPIQTLF